MLTDATADDGVPSNAALLLRDGSSLPLCTTHLDITTSCNFRCPTCIESELTRRDAHLSIPAIERFLDGIYSLGCRDLRLYGGEPTIHPGFPDVLRRACRTGFSVRVVTNGSRIGSTDIMNALVECRNNTRVRISFDGHSSDTYALHHGVQPSMLDIVRSATLEALDRGIRVTISYLLTERSLGELKEACEFWRQAGAESFAPRLLTDHGSTKILTPVAAHHRKMIRDCQSAFGPWLIVPPLLDQWLSAPDNLPRQTTPHCYVAYFRLVASPYLPEASPQLREHHAEKPVETDQIWLSACPYARLDQTQGCLCPDDLPCWWRNTHAAWLRTRSDSISRACANKVCTRATTNYLLQQSITMASLNGTAGR